MPDTQCSYCGRENDASVSYCIGCGTELVPSTVPENPQNACRPLSPQSLSALKATFGSILICTAIYYAALRAFFDIHEIAHGGPIGKPGIYAVGLFFIPISILLGIGSAFFTLVVFSRRSSTWHASLGVIVTLAVIAVVFCRPILGFWLPAFFLGRANGISAMGYLGSVIQLFLGGWLLGWFDRWLRKAETQTD